MIIAYLLVVYLCVLCVRSQQTLTTQPPKWGKTAVGATTNHMPLDCSLRSGKPICCASLNSYVHPPIHRRRGKCSVRKEYVSSPYEERQLNFLRQLSTAKNPKQTLIDFITSKSEINDAVTWLRRVEERMLKPDNKTLPSPVDEAFLSRFHITTTCGRRSSTRIEYIEPLTVITRHPFAIHDCEVVRSAFAAAEFPSQYRRTSIQSIDHILLASSTPTRTILLDAGTSTVSSSLWYFLCGYHQRGREVHQIYAWEKTLLEPTAYWSDVPNKYKPHWQFMNIPISSTSGDPDNPLSVIKQVASIDDFVSFKLDIDTPSIEIPLALQLLSDREVTPLIDEFFFELHFRCEVLQACGWGYNIPEERDGLVLDRLHAVNLFLDLRKAGIRAHFWP